MTPTVTLTITHTGTPTPTITQTASDTPTPSVTSTFTQTPSATPTETPNGDLDKDLFVGPKDLLLLLGQYNLKEGEMLPADFDRNGKVGSEDLWFMALRWHTQVNFVK